MSCFLEIHEIKKRGHRVRLRENEHLFLRRAYPRMKPIRLSTCTRANDARNYAEKGCAMQFNGITLRLVLFCCYFCGRNLRLVIALLGIYSLRFYKIIVYYEIITIVIIITITITTIIIIFIIINYYSLTILALSRCNLQSSYYFYLPNSHTQDIGRFTFFFCGFARFFCGILQIVFSTKASKIRTAYQ